MIYNDNTDNEYMKVIYLIIYKYDINMIYKNDNMIYDIYNMIYKNDNTINKKSNHEYENCRHSGL